uniref:Uncharacterized protein n=1 Tax=Xenopus tropicalis TaxID=8364 RepID=A0A1B8Y7L6_XENTR
MADKGWDGWEVLDEDKTKAFTLRDPPVIDAGARYVWVGTFGERLNGEGERVTVPFCGRCGTTLIEEVKNFQSHCSLCYYGCWIGPYQETRPPRGRPLPGPMILGISKLSVQSDLSAEAEPFTPASSPARSVLSAKAIKEEPISPPMGGVKDSPRGTSSGEEPPVMLDRKVVARGRGRVRAVANKPSSPPTESPSEEPTDWATDGTTTIWVDKPSPTPMPTPPVPDQPPAEPVLSLPTVPLKGAAPGLNQAFWVLPGRGDPAKMRSVSRVQRMINTRVMELWGICMPYAPEWVFDEVEKKVQEWLYGEIIRRAEIGTEGVFHSDAERRGRDVEFVGNMMHEWWYGRTILKHFVKSCGKFHDDKFFSMNAQLPGGGRIDKPHPSYYLSYEETLKRFGVRP